MTDSAFDRVAESIYGGQALESGFIKLLRLLPSPYLQYYYHRRKSLEATLHKELTRGEVVQQVEAEVFKVYADPTQVSKPEALSRWGGGGYSEIALQALLAHPLVGDYDTAVPLFDELLEANRAFLPQFFPGG